MEIKGKKVYQTPLVKTIRVKAECIFCISGTRNSYGDANEDSWD